MARTIQQISCSAAYGGIEILYALCSDNTVWRAAYDRVLGEVVWRQMPDINDAVLGGAVLGQTLEPPQPQLDLALEADQRANLVDEKQW